MVSELRLLLYLLLRFSRSSWFPSHDWLISCVCAIHIERLTHFVFMRTKQRLFGTTYSEYNSWHLVFFVSVALEISIFNEMYKWSPYSVRVRCFYVQILFDLRLFARSDQFFFLINHFFFKIMQIFLILALKANS